MQIPRKWIPVFLYTAGIFIVTPFLPDLIRTASSRWSSSGVSHFVLNVELFLAGLIFAFSVFLFFLKKNKSLFLIFSLLGIFLLSFLIYHYLPNPYEFTHLPEYAVLSILISRVLYKGKMSGSSAPKENEMKIRFWTIKNSYFSSALITGVIGTADEIYQYFLPKRAFTAYDIFLNMLGGILGLLVFWGTKR